jgi:DNA-binding NtrC family response regulator
MNDTQTSILVVDDEVDTCRNLSDIFSDLGYRVDTTHDGQTALALLRQRRYDVALIDLMMPGMDGKALYDEIKRMRPGTVAVLVTGYPNNPQAESALAAGVWRIVPKPVDFSKLLRLVEEAVDQPLVLVVDDDRELCLNLWDLLRERGYRVCLAHDVNSAAERLRNDGFKVILLDMKLPDGTGVDVLKHAQKADPEARVIVITGFREGADAPVQQLLSEGAQVVLDKPLDVSRLLALVQQATSDGKGQKATATSE